MPLDLDEIRSEWLNQCGPCDFGMPEYPCMCAQGDPRLVILKLVNEVERLRLEARPLALLDAPHRKGFISWCVDNSVAPYLSPLMVAGRYLLERTSSEPLSPLDPAWVATYNRLLGWQVPDVEP